jgi:hypothetical protein
MGNGLSSEKIWELAKALDDAIDLYFYSLELAQAFSLNPFDRILIRKVNTASLKGLQ